MAVVNKPNGDIRLCIDPKDLNEAILRPHIKIPSFEVISSKMAGAKVFT